MELCVANISDFLPPESHGVCYGRQVMPSWSLAYSEFHLIHFIFIKLLIEIDGNLFLTGSNTLPRVGDWGRGLPHVNTSYCFRKSAFTQVTW